MDNQLTASHWRLLAIIALFLNVVVWGSALLLIFDRI